MLESLSSALDDIFRRLRGRGALSPGNVKDALGEVRKALLAADVNFHVAKEFVKRVEHLAVGQEVLRSISPGQQVVKIVYDELVRLMGSSASTFALDGAMPAVVMLVGLQGSGKTTACGKLALFVKGKGRHPHLVAADVYRPAAIDQLEQIGRQAGVPVFRSPEGTSPVNIAHQGIAAARKAGDDVVILDTAGRLNIDEEMMRELEAISAEVKPQETLLVVDAMTGQIAAEVARDFGRRLDLTGVILSKMDGDARGGAALSVREVSGKPIKFISTGETLDALDVFHPDRMANRILGMGDIVSLVERAQAAVNQEEARELEKKLRTRAFTLDDFLGQLQQVKKMGPLDQLLGMLPGMNRELLGAKVDDKALGRIEAMIHSMTREERERPEIINGGRRRRISTGSGTTVQELNRLLKQFDVMRKMLSKHRPGSKATAAAMSQKLANVSPRRFR
ncbi:MAG: Signal recognition particle protein [Candidatus Latescibacteria bacterium ADurb.Bin168]|nr:MAG: Signal recognition particle protein [Candidatus Latescibacteria bacterium ADurb.Bin168]